MPLYAFDKSIEDMALEPPKAKNEAYWRRIDVIVSSLAVRSSHRRACSWVSKSRKMGMLVMRDSIMRNSVRRSWNGQRKSASRYCLASAPLSAPCLLTPSLSGNPRRCPVSRKNGQEHKYSNAGKKLYQLRRESIVLHLLHEEPRLKTDQKLRRVCAGEPCLECKRCQA